MYKIYCDICKKEITKVNSIAGEFKKLIGIPNKKEHVQLEIVLREIPTEVDICKYCVFDSVKKMDDRYHAKEYQKEIKDE